MVADPQTLAMELASTISEYTGKSMDAEEFDSAACNMIVAVLIRYFIIVAGKGLFCAWLLLNEIMPGFGNEKLWDQCKSTIIVRLLHSLAALHEPFLHVRLFYES